MALLGLAIMIVSEVATLTGVEPFASWNTPICWTGFILFADAVVFRARGDSWIRSAPREFVAMTLMSIPLWLVFEGFNLVIRNWSYVGLPESRPLRLFGYAWSFATITPAIFEGADLASLARRRPGASGESGGSNDRSSLPGLPDLPGPRRRALAAIALGAAMLISPFLAPEAIAPYLAAPVFLGFIFLLDPINAGLGAESLTRDRTINLMLSGLLCGVLWEFWNYWARAKWVYTVPIMEHLKVFEMPLPGFFGFPPFALECFTMYVFGRILYVRLTGTRNRGRTIAL